MRSRACATPGTPEQKLWGWDSAAWLLTLGLAEVCFHEASSLTFLAGSQVALQLRGLCLWNGAAWLLALGLAGVCFHGASSVTFLVSSPVALGLQGLCLHPCHDAQGPILAVACPRVAPDPLCSGDHLLLL